MTKRMSMRLTQGSLVPFFLEPLIQFGELAVIEIAGGDGDKINITACRVECVVGQRPPQVDSDKIVTEINGRSAAIA